MMADYKVVNKYGADVLHMAAQGNQPASLFYFVTEKGLDINSKDNRGSSPLHWACYTRSDLVLPYVLALKPDIEQKDNLGFTPLHLAVRSYDGTKQTNKMIRAILLKGADRKALTNDKQDV